MTHCLLLMIPLYIYSFRVILRETDLKRSFFVHAIFESAWYTHVTTQWRQPCIIFGLTQKCLKKYKGLGAIVVLWLTQLSTMQEVLAQRVFGGVLSWLNWR
jgi:hypothetical protein